MNVLRRSVPKRAAVAVGTIVMIVLLAVLLTPADTSTAAPSREQACTCHDVGAETVLTVSGVPTEYTPGATYTITITVDDTNGPTAGENGFYLTITGGTLSNPSTDAEINDPAASASTADDRPMQTASWTVDWTAPDSGGVTIDVWGVSATDTATGSKAPADQDTFGLALIPEFPALLLPIVGVVGTILLVSMARKRASK